MWARPPDVEENEQHAWVEQRVVHVYKEMLEGREMKEIRQLKL